MLDRIRKFLSFWYLRYMLATELYMVEPWERAVIHVIYAVMFSLLWYFNYTLATSGIGGLTNSKTYVERVL